MGTWGADPFGNDTAEDFLAGLAPLSSSERLEFVVRAFKSALEETRSSSPDVLPEEVISAAAVVAANLPTGESFPWNEEVPGITQWLSSPVPAQVSALAIEALDASLPPDGWWWRSWFDDADRAEMKSSIERIKSVLRGN
jgi:hypothetical protein